MKARAHQIAWPRPSGTCWRTVVIDPGSLCVAAQCRHRLRLAAFAQRRFQFVRDVEMLDQRGLAAAGDHAELLDAGGAGLLDRVLDQRLVDDRQHFLGRCLGGGQEARAKTGDRQDGFAQFLDHGSTPI